MPQIDRLFIALQQLRDALRQMLITSMSGCQQWMALIVMHPHYPPTPKVFPAKLAHRSPRNQHITVDRFAMPIDVENGPLLLLFLLFLGLLVMPQGPCPLCHRISETLICSGPCQPGEKLLDVGIAVGTASPCEQC